MCMCVCVCVCLSILKVLKLSSLSGIITSKLQAVKNDQIKKKLYKLHMGGKMDLLKCVAVL